MLLLFFSNNSFFHSHSKVFRFSFQFTHETFLFHEIGEKRVQKQEMVGAKREKTEKEIYTKRYANFGRIFSVTFAPEAATATELPVREAHTVSDN